MEMLASMLGRPFSLNTNRNRRLLPPRMHRVELARSRKHVQLVALTQRTGGSVIRNSAIVAIMTRYERISIALALTALILAVASPIVSYYWFDPQFQAFRHRARLQVTK